MADFIESEAEESEEEDLEPHERKKAKRVKAVDSSEEEEDDEDRLREELKDLIDDAPIDESDGEDTDASGGSKKRKKSDDEEYDDRLEDEDYDLIEENLGVKVERRKFKRLRRIQDEESEGEGEHDEGQDREAIAAEIFSDDDDEKRSERSHRVVEPENFDEEASEGEYSDADDFIVDDDGRPIAEKKKKRKPIFSDAALQEAQETFGVDFDYDEFSKYDEDEYDEESEEDDYVDEEGEDSERRRRPKKAARKKPSRKSIFEVYEPSELKRGFFTDLDNEIRNTDIPERMQLREFPVTAVPEDSTELDDEAEWIYKQAFCKATVTMQDAHLNAEARECSKKGPQTVGKIRKALDFMRNQQLEVPFIAFYRKEYVQPELNINDLWKVYKFDAKWCQLRTRKQNLLALFEKMRSYQLDQLMANPDAPIPDAVRVMKDEDIERLKAVQTSEELRDVHNHFSLYYAHELPNMQVQYKLKEREKLKADRRAKRLQQLADAEEAGEEIPLEDPEPEDEEEPEPTLKYAARSGPYAMCSKAGIDCLAKKFGLTPSQFAENLRDNYQRHEVEQEPTDLNEVAKTYTGTTFITCEEVLQAAKFMVSVQIAREPLVRRCVREVFFERAKISVKPTKKGIKEIDEAHNCYGMKYMKDKPARDLTSDQFLRLTIAEEEKLLTIGVDEKIEGNTSSSYIDEVKQLYIRDEFSKNVQDWNAVRVECVERALSKFILPDIKRELRQSLLAEAKECVLKSCCRKLYTWLKTAPYKVEFPDEEEDEWDTSKGLRVMAIAYVPDYSQAAFTCMASPDGDITDYLRLPHILKRKNSYRVDEKMLKEADLLALKNFINTKKPHVICVGGESREALMIVQDLKEVVANLVEEEQFPSIAVELIDNELAKVYANSNKGTTDFREYPELLRVACSLARRMQDPLIEFSQLCTADEEILSLRYHSLQEQIGREELLDNLYLEFVNRVNEVGVDINLAVQQNHTNNLVQFVCGLGPRKGQALLKVLKQTNQRLENRTQLVTACHMGPKVFINCSGFIKIDTNSLGDSTEAYVEVLDGSRVHPETYEWARKMAVDALEYDDEDANPAGALEEILEAPERLKDLDLDAFAEELERQGFGNKSITLYDIRAELNYRYKDLRTPFVSANPEETFDMLTKECPETFFLGKMVIATVAGISHRKPQGEQLDQANPVRNDETGLWQCPFCLKNDFPELSEVWNHFDTGACPGQATGVKLRLDNGISGYIHIKNLSDKHVTNPEERVGVGQMIHCRITKIDVERFSVDCTSKSSDLADKKHEWRPPKDLYYDQDAEDRDLKTEIDAKKNKQRQTYIKRVIVHPQFHNISFMEAEKLMTNMDQGEVVIRPSSKGADHLTITWKVANGIYQHIDVREEGKANAFSLGSSLWIGNEEFEDLDEIIARHVNPMAAHARDLLYFRYYKESEGGLKDKMEEFLKEEKKKNASKIHYFVTVCKNYPGKFLLSYLPRTRCRHEYVTVTPDGFRFRQQMFDSVAALFKWFKEHFRDPVPGGTPSTPRGRTPYQGHAGGTTPGVMNSEAIQRVVQNLPGHVMQNLSAVASQTPHYPHTPGGAYAANTYINTPYTPSGQTPFMTPYQTPHTTQTPRYSGQTPSHLGGAFLHPASITPAQQHHAPSRTPQMHHHHHQQQQPPPHGHMPPPGHRPSPLPSPRSRGGVSNEPMDWQKAAEAWARLKQRDGMGTPRTADGRNTPRAGSTGQRTPRFDDLRGTPQYDTMSVRSSGSRSKDLSKSPRSGRSTPRTNTSPHSMSLGDATPLYDEN